MIDLDDYRRLKESIERNRSKSERAAGVADQLKRQLHEEFGIEAGDVEEELVRIDTKKDKLDKEVVASLIEFKEKYPEL